MWSPGIHPCGHLGREIVGGRPSAASAGALLLVALVASGGCAPEPASEPEEMEPVEISAGPTSAMTPDSDEVASSGDEMLIGALPGGFPESFPLPEPASVVDFGSEHDRFVVLRTTLSRDEARRQLARRLDASGWAAAGDPWTRTKGRDRVVVRFETGNAGQTLVRVEYGSR
ncbi:MAG TPA: hypothetical protein VMT85_05405 [Thermoanaerobaculia bacterium]|nr:hypothetical protein [Thermoanaerobaculia bacterium]